MNLLLKAFAKFILGLLIASALLFIPAGSLNYLNAWLFIGLLFVPILIVGIVLFIKSPELLKKRLNNKEKENTQKFVVIFSGLLLILGFIIAGLDFRFSWSKIPTWITIIGSVILLVSYVLYAEVLRENAYLSRTVEIQKDQKVIDSGLYGIVRHPMYAATLWLFLAIPIVLGSWYSLICFFPYIAILFVRIRNEEKVLEDGLDGYAEYKKRVKYRIIPFIW